MRVVKPFGEILYAPSIAALRFIEFAARISHDSTGNITADSYLNFVQKVCLDHGDLSVIEHSMASVLFKVDRGITHELVRHRLFSYTQSSTRFVNYAKQKDGVTVHPAEFIYPKVDVSCEHCYGGDEPTEYQDGFFHGTAPQIRCVFDRTWLKQIKSAEESYKKLVLEDKWRPQEARSVFPTALASTIQMTGNLRSWRHFFIMRTTVETHPQMRQVVNPLLDKFKEKIPLLFDDITPGSRQVDNLKKAR